MFLYQDVRGKMNQHIEQSKVNHEILILSTVKEFKQKSEKKDLEIQELKQKSKQKDLKIEELKKKSDEKDASMHELEHDLENLRRDFDQLTITVENNEKQTKTCFDEMKVTETQHSNKIKNLETFAGRCTKIHFTLSEEYLRRNYHHGYTLFQEDYDKDEDVKEWNKIVEEVNEDDNECDYLAKLKDSVNQYQETIYSPTYKERLKNFCYFTPVMTKRGEFIRIGCNYDFKRICVNIYHKRRDFTNEIERIDERRTCKVQTLDVCSFYIDDCLHVLLYGHYCSRIFLLHKSDEDKKLELPEGAAVKLDNYHHYTVNNSVVLYLKL